MTRFPFLVTCEARTEGALRDELVGLGIRKPRGGPGRVTFEAPLKEAMRVCLHARTAMRVLLQVGYGPCANSDELYETVRSVNWSEHLDPQHTFAIHAHVRNSETLTHSQYVAQKVKDAIADGFRDNTGSRPNVERNDPDVPIVVYIDGTEAELYLDLAGPALHRRGYRVAMTDAPLKETLACAVLALGQVTAEKAFLDPMCGSGTFAIEQAMRARRMAPGLGRTFAFERWPSQEHIPLWKDLCEAARAEILPDCPAPIFASDQDGNAIAAARRNAQVAGVEKDIAFAVKECSQATPPAAEGTVCFNPPYGERVVAQNFRPIARALSMFWGWYVVVISPERFLQPHLGQAAMFCHRLSNGGLPVELQRFSFVSARNP
ncbi:MAG: THUMP domain-containing protein [Deltaproteobacteria bacterium]|nr:THUMP domain-containing protein [Deltaproteobacteria bacterium]